MLPMGIPQTTLGNMLGVDLVHRPCPRKLFQKAYLWNVYLNLHQSESDRRRIQVHNSREPNLAVHQLHSDTLDHPELSRIRSYFEIQT